MVQRKSDVVLPFALSALLGPGMGQIYNREYKKGLIHIGVSFFIFVAFLNRQTKLMFGHLPLTESSISAVALQDVLKLNSSDTHPLTYYTYGVLLMGVWVYSMLDAYLGGMRRRKAAAVTPRV